VAFTFTPAPGAPIDHPIFQIAGYTPNANVSAQTPTISVNGSAILVNTGGADSGAFVSVDTASHTLWVTLNEIVSASTSIQIQAPTP
jgi:hypothetical protein